MCPDTVFLLHGEGRSDQLQYYNIRPTHFRLATMYLRFPSPQDQPPKEEGPLAPQTRKPTVNACMRSIADMHMIHVKSLTLAGTGITPIRGFT